MKNRNTYGYFYEKYGFGEISIHQDLFCRIKISPRSIIFYKNIDDVEKWHRLDGPAFIGFHGNIEWWINDNEVTEKIYFWAKENDINLDNLSEDDISLIKLIWGDYGNL